MRSMPSVRTRSARQARPARPHHPGARRARLRDRRSGQPPARRTLGRDGREVGSRAGPSDRCGPCDVRGSRGSPELGAPRRLRLRRLPCGWEPDRAVPPLRKGRPSGGRRSRRCPLLEPRAPRSRSGAASSSSAARNAPQPSGTYREVDIFDQRANAWTRGPDLPNPRHGVGVVVVDGTKSIVGGDPVFTVFTPARLLVLGGGPLPGGSQTAVCEALDLR